MYDKERVLVAGGTGVLGFPIVNELVLRGAQVTVVGMEKKSVATKYLAKNVNYVRADLLDIENCRKIFKNHNIVINLAGTKRSVGIGYKGISRFFVDMLRLQTNIMETAFNLNVDRFLFVGSIAEYPPLDIRSEDEVWNGKPAQNDWFTGVQKRIGEAQSEAYLLDTGWDAVRIVRPSNVYGPFDNFGAQNGQVIPALISKLISNPRQLQIIGDGSNIRDFIFSEDVAHWSLEALEKAPPNFAINIGSGDGITINEIAQNLVKIHGEKTEIQYLPEQQSGDKKRVLNISRAKEILGFTNRTSLYDGLSITLDWVKKNPDWTKNKFL
jgi:GDP-L-fucose synthase